MLEPALKHTHIYAALEVRQVREKRFHCVRITPRYTPVFFLLTFFWAVEVAPQVSSYVTDFGVKLSRRQYVYIAYWFKE